MAQIVVGSGSDELIGNIAHALIDSPDDEIVTGEHSFPRYDAAAELAPCRLVKVPLAPGYRFDLRAIADRISERTKIVYIANPNNPTGTIVRKGELDGFMRAVPERVLVVLDEAYFEFARQCVDYPDARLYVTEGRNVAALRTFSKAHGLAGIRVGYGFVPEYIADALERVRPPFNVNSLAQAAAEAALYDDAHVRRTVDNNRDGLALMQLAFERAGCEVTESFANFHYVDLKQPAAPIVQGLLKRGYIVRPVGTAPNHIRVTVGTPEENKGFIQAFGEVMAPALIQS